MSEGPDPGSAPTDRLSQSPRSWTNTPGIASLAFIGSQSEITREMIRSGLFLVFSNARHT